MSAGLQVIGAGLHRTGSMSVMAALERLGFGPCYHGMEALRRSADGGLWMAAYENRGDVDWSQIFAGYRATLDWPTIYFWEELAAAYPEAKILLTERDPEQWWQSHVSLFRTTAQFDRQLTGEQREWAQRSGFAQMFDALSAIVPARFDGRVFDREHCLKVFRAHYDRVRSTVPPGRLLSYRVQDGWGPLCRFLGVEIPDDPFPRINVGDSLFQNIRTAMRLARAETGPAVWR